MLLRRDQWRRRLSRDHSFEYSTSAERSCAQTVGARLTHTHQLTPHGPPKIRSHRPSWFQDRRRRYTLVSARSCPIQWILPIVLPTQATDLALLVSALLAKRSSRLSEPAQAYPRPALEQRRVPAPRHDLLYRLKRLWWLLDNRRVDTQARAVPLSALAAWQALFVHGGPSAGQTALIYAATGGVGVFAPQLACWRVRISSRRMCA
jgi:hypothetical protein